MMQQRVSPEAHTLGDPLGEYRTSMWAWLPLATLLMGFSGYMIWIGLQQTPIDWGAVLFGFGLLLFFAGLVVFGAFTRPWRIHVFDDGMVIQRIAGREVWHWEEITRVEYQLNIVSGLTTARVKAHRRTGRPFVATDRFAPTIEQQTTPDGLLRMTVTDISGCLFDASYSHRLNDALARFDTGEQIDFGKFRLSRAGIHVKNTTLRWDQVADIKTDGIIMIVKQVGQEQPWRALTVTSIPNEDLVPALIYHTQGDGYSAFRDDSDPRELMTVQRGRRWQRRTLGCVVIPAALIALQFGIYYASQASHYNSAQGHHARGDQHYEALNFSAALEDYTRAIELEPTVANYYVDRGRAYRELGRYDEALADYAQALALDPSNYRAIVHRGRVYYRQGRYEQAIADYNMVITQVPNDFFAYCNRGFAYKQLGQTQPAIADFTTCGELARADGWKARAEQEIDALRRGE